LQLVERIKKHEGFRTEPYIDVLVAKQPELYGISRNEMNTIQKHLGKLKLTFGYGFTNLTEDEASVLLEYRIHMIRTRLYNDQKFKFLYKYFIDVTEVLIEMVFQIGYAGLLKFVNFIGALENGDLNRAADEMLSSRWAKQTPARAQELSDIIRSLA